MKYENHNIQYSCISIQRELRGIENLAGAIEIDFIRRDTRDTDQVPSYTFLPTLLERLKYVMGELDNRYRNVKSLEAQIYQEVFKLAQAREEETKKLRLKVSTLELKLKEGTHGKAKPKQNAQKGIDPVEPPKIKSA